MLRDVTQTPSMILTLNNFNFDLLILDLSSFFISLFMLNFWLIWFINHRALYNNASCIIVMCRCWHRTCAHLPFGTGLDIETSYLVYICTHLCPSYVHIKYLVILTCSFKWQTCWYFSLTCYPAHTDSKTDFILHTYTYVSLLYLHTQKE